MKYNTELKKLALPEYGRNIQNMVDYCLTLKDREERKRCANSIINIMGNLFPHLRDVNDFKHILWDHLAIMSDFQLDIDYPYEVIKKEELTKKPEPLPYSQATMHFRHYGKSLEKIISILCDNSFETKAEYDALLWLVLTHMKKSYMQWNKEVDDDKIILDLYHLSNHKIDLRNDKVKLPDMRDMAIQQRSNNNNKKKKK